METDSDNDSSSAENEVEYQWQWSDEDDRYCNAVNECEAPELLNHLRKKAPIMRRAIQRAVL